MMHLDFLAREEEAVMGSKITNDAVVWCSSEAHS